MTDNVQIGASASEARLAYVAESTWAETPPTPAFKNLRFTSENLMPAKETVRSDEIRPDRNITDEILTGRSVAGNIEAEMSYATFDELLASALYGQWSTDELKNGVDPTSFTLERMLRLGASTQEYHRFVGCLVDTWSLTASAGAIVTTSFGVQGRFGGRGDAALTGATYDDANSNRVLNAATHFADLAVAGLTPAPRVMSLSLNAANGLRRQAELGSLDTAGIAPDRFEVTGSMECYFESGALYQAFLDHDDLGLEFTLGTEAGSRYRFHLPTIILTGDPGANATGNSADVMLTLNFTAVLDRTAGASGATLIIERGV